MTNGSAFTCCVALCAVISAGQAETQSQAARTNAVTNAAMTFQPGRKSVWESGVGEGFRRTTQSFGVSAGAVRGFAAFGGREVHDLALVSFSYGNFFGELRGRGHWYQGNTELRLEIFTGAQFSPDSQWLVGFAPHLRYDFATGTRWIPFIDAGAGVTGTGIGSPDLSGTFEFNLQAGFGIQWFVRNNVALGLDAHYLHLSCAGLRRPNLGLNGVAGMLGITYFF